MKCNQYKSVISLYIDNQLEEEHKKQFENHALNCPNCQKELDSFINIKSMCSSLPELAPPEDLHSKVMERLKIDNESKRRFRLPTHIIAPVAALLMLTLLCRGLYDFSQWQDKNDSNNYKIMKQTVGEGLVGYYGVQEGYGIQTETVPMETASNEIDMPEAEPRKRVYTFVFLGIGAIGAFILYKRRN